MDEGRCGWVSVKDPLYLAYHDEEWGVPEYDSRALWEKLVLDGFQAGLAWITILRKREAFRAAFADFDPEVDEFAAKEQRLPHFGVWRRSFHGYGKVVGVGE